MTSAAMGRCVYPVVILKMMAPRVSDAIDLWSSECSNHGRRSTV
jgi:hypothetical protein